MKENKNSNEIRGNSDSNKKNNKLKYFLDEIKKDESRDIYNYDYNNQIKQKDFLSLSKKNKLDRDNNYSSKYITDRNIISKSHLNDFSQFKSELTNLQCNIDKLERKLCKYKNNLIIVFK